MPNHAFGHNSAIHGLTADSHGGDNDRQSEAAPEGEQPGTASGRKDRDLKPFQWYQVAAPKREHAATELKDRPLWKRTVFRTGFKSGALRITARPRFIQHRRW